ncbi:MAG: ATP synthase F0 subunit A [Planctomycetota bacterium]|nr:MAG: ATP synthase F0 subunit A [Planctomycetota bacterium]REJ87619.1 MAG: ATP synthase F0 subunit A [Planctomycetota bacterium]REK30169.1 MAG: ATP synthase F0 subunit A [Planctomycetota bacterium]REK43304.1 MAG: ATP synthase F0 subunit A [Planctomycetota bacterium]
MAANPIDHVKDATYFEVPQFIQEDGKLEIPQIFQMMGLPDEIYGQPLQFTKFMVLELVAAVVLIAIFVPLAQRMARSDAPRGRLWNFFEAILLFLRDEVARPAIGSKDAGKFMPYLWTIFFFVLACNLIGMLPWSGTATSALGTTSALAATAFVVTIGSGMSRLGVFGFLKAQVPHMGLPLPLAIVLVPLIFAIEIVGLLIKHTMLALRLLANMFGGHVVLAVLMSFIAVTAGTGMWGVVMPASVLGCTAMNMLELFVAFLQAYIFTFLSALFIGMALHPH